MFQYVCDTKCESWFLTRHKEDNFIVKTVKHWDRLPRILPKWKGRKTLKTLPFEVRFSHPLCWPVSVQWRCITFCVLQEVMIKVNFLKYLVCGQHFLMLCFVSPKCGLILPFLCLSKKCSQM